MFERLNEVGGIRGESKNNETLAAFRDILRKLISKESEIDNLKKEIAIKHSINLKALFA